MQVKFRHGSRESFSEIKKVRPSIIPVEVYYDPEDGSLYIVEKDSKNESKTRFEQYLENEMKISFENE